MSVGIFNFLSFLGDQIEEVPKEEVKIGKYVISVRLDNEDRKIANQKLADALEEVLSNTKEKRPVIREAAGIATQLFRACTARVGAKMEDLEFVLHSDEGRLLNNGSNHNSFIQFLTTLL